HGPWKDRSPSELQKSSTRPDRPTSDRFAPPIYTQPAAGKRLPEIHFVAQFQPKWRPTDRLIVPTQSSSLCNCSRIFGNAPPGEKCTAPSRSRCNKRECLQKPPFRKETRGSS